MSVIIKGFFINCLCFWCRHIQGVLSKCRRRFVICYWFFSTCRRNTFLCNIFHRYWLIVIFFRCKTWVIIDPFISLTKSRIFLPKYIIKYLTSTSHDIITILCLYTCKYKAVGDAHRAVMLIAPIKSAS